ncbi:unnamed protein product, partial [Musa hybrid cultivar]
LDGFISGDDEITWLFVKKGEAFPRRSGHHRRPRSRAFRVIRLLFQLGRSSEPLSLHLP